MLCNILECFTANNVEAKYVVHDNVRISVDSIDTVKLMRYAWLHKAGPECNIIMVYSKIWKMWNVCMSTQ